MSSYMYGLYVSELHGQRHDYLQIFEDCRVEGICTLVEDKRGRYNQETRILVHALSSRLSV